MDGHWWGGRSARKARPPPPPGAGERVPRVALLADRAAEAGALRRRGLEAKRAEVAPCCSGIFGAAACGVECGWASWVGGRRGGGPPLPGWPQAGLPRSAVAAAWVCGMQLDAAHSDPIHRNVGGRAKEWYGLWDCTSFPSSGWGASPKQVTNRHEAEQQACRSSFGTSNSLKLHPKIFNLCGGAHLAK